MGKLTKAQRAKLETAEGAAGIITVRKTGGFARASHDRVMVQLVADGLAEPNAHGDHYITDAGRAALAQQGD